MNALVEEGIYALTLGLKYKSGTELVIFVVIQSQTELIFTKYLSNKILNHDFDLPFDIIRYLVRWLLSLTVFLCLIILLVHIVYINNSKMIYIYFCKHFPQNSFCEQFQLIIQFLK